MATTTATLFCSSIPRPSHQVSKSRSDDDLGGHATSIPYQDYSVKGLYLSLRFVDRRTWHFWWEHRSKCQVRLSPAFRVTSFPGAPRSANLQGGHLNVAELVVLPVAEAPR